MNTSSPSPFPVLHESESPVPGDFFAVTADSNTGLRMNKKGNGYVGTQLPNNIWGRFDFAAPGLASLIWGSTRPDDVPWVIKQVELPPAIAPAASLRRVYLLTCAPLPVNLCAFCPSVTDEEEAWNLFEAIPDAFFFALRRTTLINPKFKDVVGRWEVKGLR